MPFLTPKRYHACGSAISSGRGIDPLEEQRSDDPLEQP
jgi:hypothetical protein